MAVLSRRTTDQQLSWNKYVRDNKKWKELTLEIEKKMTGVGFFIKEKGKYVSTNTVLSEGDQLKLVSNRSVVDGSKVYANVTYGKRTGFVPINKIRKPSGFDSVKDEKIAMENLDNLIKSIGYPIDIQIDGDSTVYKKITGVQEIKGTPKADFACSAGLQNKIFISHKKAGGAKAFQQYGGLTEAAGDEINAHPEVQAFLSKVADNVEDGRLTQPVYSFVKDKKLVNLSIYGPNYGRVFGEDNCQLIGQGQAQLQPTDKDGLFILTFDDHIALNGNVDLFMQGDYTAVFAATYRAGRGFNLNGQRIEGARVGIYPKLFIINRTGALEV